MEIERQYVADDFRQRVLDTCGTIAHYIKLTGIPERTVRAWVSGETALPHYAVVRLEQCARRFNLEGGCNE